MSSSSRCSISWRLIFLLSRTAPSRSPQAPDIACRSCDRTDARNSASAGSGPWVGLVSGTATVRVVHAPASSIPHNSSFLTRGLLEIGCERKPAHLQPATTVMPPALPPQRLYINIDHIATIRQARRGAEPVPVEAVALCERAGADGITAHLREDRRHIQDADIVAIAKAATEFNLEMACTPEMIALAERLKPLEVTLVPEKRQEVTTEGGLAVAANAAALGDALRRLRDAGIKTSLFIDPDRESISRSRDLGAHAVELHTGTYAHAPGQGPALE